MISVQGLKLISASDSMLLPAASLDPQVYEKVMAYLSLQWIFSLCNNLDSLKSPFFQETCQRGYTISSILYQLQIN